MKPKLCLRSISLCTLILFAPSWSWAKNLTGHVGLGFSQPLDTTPPAIDVKYALTEAMAISGGFSLDTRDNNNAVAIGGKFYRNVFSEENANFYMGASFWFVNQQTNGATSNGILLGGFMGVEFFLQGLPRLGFVLETGVVLETVNGVRFRTDAGSFVTAGMHYYF